MEIADVLWIVMVHGLVFGATCFFIGKTRQVGALAGGFIGFVLGTIGLIIVLCSPKKEIAPFEAKLQTYKALLENGSITLPEYYHLKGRLFEQY